MVTLVFYCLVVNIYEHSMFYWFFVLLTIGAINVQTIAQIVGIIFSDNQRLAVFSSVGAFILSFLLSNFTIPTKEVHYFIKGVSNLSTIKLILESILIIQYGFDRCDDKELSLVLYTHGVHNQHLFINLRLLFFQFVFFRIISLIVILLKVNPLGNIKQQKRSYIESRIKRKASKILVL